MRGQNSINIFRSVGAALVALLLLTTWFAQPAAGVTPPLQDSTPPRPTLPPPQPTSAGPGGPGVKEEGGVVSDHCAGLRGTVINWGYQNEPGITLRLGDGGWEVVQITSTDGRYGFGSLGEGIAFLKTDLTAGQAKTLHPMVGDVAIRLRCDFDIVANLGLYSSPQRPALPVTLTMKVSSSALLPGKTATFYLNLKNSMPNPISHVFLTDYLPDGLTVTNVTAARGSVEVLNGRMVTINVGDLPQGDEETVQIAVQADPALANGTRLKNAASLLYAESVADQAGVTLVVGRGEGAPVAQAVTPPTATPLLPPTQTPTPGAATPTPATSKTPTPTPSSALLPITGQDAPLILPAIGFVLALVVLGAYNLRRRSPAA